MKKLAFCTILSLAASTNVFADQSCSFNEAISDNELNLYSYNCDMSKQMDNVVRFANANPNITRINLSSNYLVDKDVAKLVNLRFVSELILNDNRLSDDSVKTISKGNRYVYLDFSGNNITDDAVAEIVKNKNLELIGLSHTRITDKSAKLLANSSAHWIDVAYNGLGDASAIVLAQDKELYQLHMEDNNVGDEGAKAFGKATFNLQTNQVLIHLSNNKIGTEGVQALYANKAIAAFVNGNPGAPDDDQDNQALNKLFNANKDTKIQTIHRR